MTTQSKTETQQHTPGPWDIHDTGNQVIVSRQWRGISGMHPTFGSALGAHVAHIDYCRTGVATKEQANANARLIAAAPDMLTALILVREWLDGSKPEPYPSALTIVRAAIAKATGAQS